MIDDDDEGTPIEPIPKTANPARELRRFTSETMATAWAKRQSKKHPKETYYVIHSAARTEGSCKPDPDGQPDPYCVDTDGFVRSWERCLATFENGRKVRA
jgi:hypothetical protein